MIESLLYIVQGLAIVGLGILLALIILALLFLCKIVWEALGF